MWGLTAAAKELAAGATRPGSQAEVALLYASIRYVNIVLDVAERRGLSRSGLCERAGIAIPPKVESDLRIPVERYYDLWGIAMAELRDPTLPLRVARRMSAASFDALGFAMLTSGNLREAMRIVQRYLPFVTNAAQWDVEERAGSVLIEPRLLGPARPEQSAVEEWSLAHVVLMARHFTGRELTPLEVTLRAPPPADPTPHQELFRTPLSYGAPRSTLLMSSESMAAPFTKSEPALAAFFEKQLGKAISDSDPSMTARVRQLIAEGLPRRDVSPGRVAKHLGLSQRSLRRQLEREGVSFLQLLDETRQTVAKHYLAQRSASLGEIAFSLGYSEVSAFHRAFRRWTGMTPDAFRGG